jgi:hypothetical protein
LLFDLFTLLKSKKNPHNVKIIFPKKIMGRIDVYQKILDKQAEKQQRALLVEEIAKFFPAVASSKGPYKVRIAVRHLMSEVYPLQAKDPAELTPREQGILKIHRENALLQKLLYDPESSHGFSRKYTTRKKGSVSGSEEAFDE